MLPTCWLSYLMWKFASHHIHYLPTPPLGQDMTQGQFFSGV